MSTTIDDALSLKQFQLKSADEEFFQLVYIKISGEIVDIWRGNNCKLTPDLRIKMISALTIYLRDLPGEGPFALNGAKFVQYASEIASLAICQISSSGFTSDNLTIQGWAAKVDEFRSSQVEKEEPALTAARES